MGKSILKEALIIDSSPIIVPKEIEKWERIIIDGIKYPYEVSSNGQIRNIETEKILKTDVNKKGYHRVTLYHKNKPHRFAVHRIVGLMFIPIPLKYSNQNLTYKDLVIDHINEDPSDNWVGNLRWLTNYENIMRGERSDYNAIETKSSDNKNTKIPTEVIMRICELISLSYNNEYICNKTCIPKRTIQSIRSRNSYKEISKNYVFPKLAKNLRYTQSIDVIHKICKLLEKKCYSDPEIAKMCGVKREYVKDVRTHRRRKDISMNYTF